MTTTTADNPADIEREIRRTQENMSSTVDKIGDQFSVKNMFNALLEKADDNNVDARMLLDGARSNPVALGLIAVGAIWLISEKDSKIPSLPSLGSKFSGKSRKGSSFGTDNHSDYDLHMSSIQQNADEDHDTFQSRREAAQASYFKVKPDRGEDQSKFRQRLDSMATALRNKRQAFSASSGQAGTAAKEKAQAVANKAQNLYSDNPLIGGILAMAAGAAAGSALPVSNRERSTLGSIGEKARNAVSERTGQMTGQIREKKDAMLDKADAMLNKSGEASSETQQDNMSEQQNPRVRAY